MKRFKKYKFKDGKSITIQENSFGNIEIKYSKDDVLRFLRIPYSSEIEVDNFLNLIIDTSECNIIEYKDLK